MAGDLDDPELPVWPAGLPRRTLPRGWRRASIGPGDPLNASHALSSPYPQGLSVGVVQPHWKAWAARAWNPVETGDEPPWSPAWDLRHASTGIALSLPWTVSAQFTETRIQRGAADSVAEQQWATGLASPGEDMTLVGALSKARREEGSEGGSIGWALATALHHRFGNSMTLEVTARQRDDDWASSWDPAVTDAVIAAADSSDAGWGAGEFRLAGRTPLLEAETWRAWNPVAGTRREGVRGRATWRGENARVDLTGTRRSARAASGSVSLYRYLEAETRLEENPRFRLAAYRAWNGSGPTRTGLFLGMEPLFEKDGRSLRVPSGLRVETDADDRLSAQASLGARWVFARGWNLDAVATAPCYPRWNAEETRWRVTVNYAMTARGPSTGSGTRAREGL